LPLLRFLHPLPMAARPGGGGGKFRVHQIRCNLKPTVSLSKELTGTQPVSSAQLPIELKKRNLMRIWWPAVICTLCVWAAVYFMCRVSIGETGGVLVYPLDDTYLHMSMAANFAEHGVWGYTKHAFSSSTTSPLWTAILAAAFAVFGRNDLLPLLINLLFGACFIFLAYRLFFTEMSRTAAFIFLAAIAAVTSVPALVLTAMEHVLHATLTVVFLKLAADLLSGRRLRGNRSGIFYAAAALLPVTRYEALFTVAVIVLFLFLRKQFRTGIAVAGASAVFVLLYAVISLAHGWYPVPNSLLLKGNHTAIDSILDLPDALGMNAVRVISGDPILLLVLFLALAACLLRDRSACFEDDPRWWAAASFIAILFLHLQNAWTGWLYRYEAYLIAAGLSVSLPVVWEYAISIVSRVASGFPRRLPLIIPLLFIPILVYRPAKRAYKACAVGVMAMRDRHLGHYQAAAFLREHYRDATVVVNDVGAVSYFADSRLLDMYGLGNMQPLKYRTGQSGYDSNDVEAWAKVEGAEIAVLQVEWLEISGRIPESWKLAAEWRLPRNIVFNDTRIGFYAVRQEAVSALRDKLRIFRHSLPAEVEMVFCVDE
jgi:hypothetical protein